MIICSGIIHGLVEYLVATIFLFGSFSPLIHYFWYKKRGGKTGTWSFIWFGLLVYLFLNIAIVEKNGYQDIFSAIIAFDFMLEVAILNIVLAPRISRSEYKRLGGKNEWFVFLIWMPFLALAIKGVAYLVCG